jgi:hypothetical protein
MAIEDRPPRPTSGRLPENLPLSDDEETPGPPSYYVPLAADPSIDYDRLQDRRRAVNEVDAKRQATLTANRNKSGVGSKTVKRKAKADEDEDDEDEDDEDEDDEDEDDEDEDDEDEDDEDEDDEDEHEEDEDEVPAPVAKKGRIAAPKKAPAAKKRALAAEKENVAPGSRRSKRLELLDELMDLDS